MNMEKYKTFSIELQRAGEARTLIEQSLKLLAEKRKTVTEEIIVRYCHRLLHALDEYIKIADTLTCQRLTDFSKTSIQKLNNDMLATFSELLKMANYDANFFEQYYEYEFCSRLTNELIFVDRVNALICQLKNQSMSDV